MSTHRMRVYWLVAGCLLALMTLAVEAAPRVTKAIPKSVQLSPGKSVTVELRGTLLNKFVRAEIYKLRSNRPAPGFRLTLSRGNNSKRKLTVMVDNKTRVRGAFEVKLKDKSGRLVAKVPLAVKVVSARAKAKPQPKAKAQPKAKTQPKATARSKAITQPKTTAKKPTVPTQLSTTQKLTQSPQAKPKVSAQNDIRSKVKKRGKGSSGLPTPPPGGTMTTKSVSGFVGQTAHGLQRTDANCKPCHQPELRSSPMFWNGQTLVVGESGKAFMYDKPPSPLATSSSVQWSISSSSVLGSTQNNQGSQHILNLNPQSPGTATVTASLTINMSNGGQINHPSVTRQVQVLSTATGISSFSFSPNPMTENQSTTATVMLNGASDGNYYVNYQKATNTNLTENTPYIPAGSNQVQYQVQAGSIPPSISGDTWNINRTATLRKTTSGSQSQQVGSVATALLAVTRDTGGGGGSPGTDTSNFAPLAAHFRHSRCTICHGVNASPSTKPSHNVGSNCMSCHTQALTGANVWVAPVGSHDFRNKTDAQLCQLALQPPPGFTATSHLKTDPLVVWAIIDGDVPGLTRPTVPVSKTQWDALVDAWGGVNCPP